MGVRSPSPPAASVRDPRLDFFRGSAMFIIFFAHCRGNVLWNIIPARFGVSDAADMFVFLSGMAAAIAFGGTFVRQGMVIGTARIAYRCAQLFIAQLGLFFTGAMIIAAGTRWYGDIDYAALLNLQRFFADPGGALDRALHADLRAALFRHPAALYRGAGDGAGGDAAGQAASAGGGRGLGRALCRDVAFRLRSSGQRRCAAGVVFQSLRLAAHLLYRFRVRRGWVMVPLNSRLLFWGSVIVLGLGLGISLPFVFERVPPIDALRLWIAANTDKTNLDLLQYVHFLAEAYVAVVLLRARVDPVERAAQTVRALRQQALTTYFTCETLAQIGGMVFDHAGTGVARADRRQCRRDHRDVLGRDRRAMGQARAVEAPAGASGGPRAGRGAGSGDRPRWTCRRARRGMIGRCAGRRSMAAGGGRWRRMHAAWR